MRSDLADAPGTGEELSKEYKKLQLRLRNVEKLKKSKAVFAVIALISVMMAVFCDTMNRNSSIPGVYSMIASVVVGLFVGTIIYLYLFIALMVQEGVIRRKLIDCETVNLQNALSDTDTYNDLIKMSYKYLDQYYSQTREHAQRGFLATMGVSLLGALLIVAGVIAMFLGSTTPAYVTSASGIVTKFISAVFFYLYNKTVSSMSNYHNKLVMAQNISIALAAADSLPEAQKAEAKKQIIGELTKNLNEYFIGGEGKSSSPD